MGGEARPPVDFNPRSPQGGATNNCSRSRFYYVFQSTLPARGSDLAECFKGQPAKVFQSTLPARGSDPCNAFAIRCHHHFNPRSPQGGATYNTCLFARRLNISIHAPRKGERLKRLITGLTGVGISIHAPRKGERQRLAVALACYHHMISIHAPSKGERHSFLKFSLAVY